MKKPVIPSSQDTILAILERSKRQAVPIRRSFVRSDGAVGRPPLAELVRHHDERALDLYLLILAQASGGDYDVTHPAAVWARALGLDNKSGVAAVSKVLARLVECKLVERDRVRRLAHIGLLREDGSGRPYAHPAVAGDYYLQLPHEYWTKEFHRQLTLPAKAALLVARSMPDNFFLTVESAPKQFGMSADTIEKGLRELRGLKLLNQKVTYRLAPLTAAGSVREYRYKLRAPFDQLPGSQSAAAAPTPPGPAAPGSP